MTVVAWCDGAVLLTTSVKFRKDSFMVQLSVVVVVVGIGPKKYF